MRAIAKAALHLFVLTLLSFGLASLAPGDVLSEARFDPTISPATRARLEEQLEPQLSWPQRYGHWLVRFVQGDFGTSFSYQMPVSSLLGRRLANTAATLLPAWLLSWLLGTALAWLAVRTNWWRALEGLASVLVLLPEPVTATLFTWLLLVYLGGSDGNVWLPIFLLSLALTPAIFLHTAGALAQVSQSRFVQLAVVAGVRPRTLWWRYKVPAMVGPLLSLVGPTLLSAFGSALVIEAITGWPGVGSLFLEAFQSRDYPITQAVLLLLGTLVLACNLSTDLLLRKLHHDAE